jgi:hypothetical protein
MMHFFRRPEIHLDVFTDQAYIMESTPIDFASKHMPNWWKGLPNSELDSHTLQVNKTMKHCVGMIDFYKKSFCVPMWSDLAVTFQDGEYRWQYADQRSSAAAHPVEQYAGFLSSTCQHLKLDSPWLIKCKDEVNFLASQPTYSHGKHITNYIVLPGVVNFKHQAFTNIQLVFDTAINKTLLVPRGVPICMYTPMTEKKIVLHRHLVATSKMDSIKTENTTAFFTRSYLKTVKLKQKFSCPYKDETK